MDGAKPSRGWAATKNPRFVVKFASLVDGGAREAGAFFRRKIMCLIFLQKSADIPTPTFRQKRRFQEEMWVFRRDPAPAFSFISLEEWRYGETRVNFSKWSSNFPPVFGVIPHCKLPVSLGSIFEIPPFCNVTSTLGRRNTALWPIVRQKMAGQMKLRSV